MNVQLYTYWKIPTDKIMSQQNPYAGLDKSTGDEVYPCSGPDEEYTEPRKCFRRV